MSMTREVLQSAAYITAEIGGGAPRVAPTCVGDLSTCVLFSKLLTIYIRISLIMTIAV